MLYRRCLLQTHVRINVVHNFASLFAVYITRSHQPKLIHNNHLLLIDIYSVSRNEQLCPLLPFLPANDMFDKQEKKKKFWPRYFYNDLLVAATPFWTLTRTLCMHFKLKWTFNYSIAYKLIHNIYSGVLILHNSFEVLSNGFCIISILFSSLNVIY